MPASHISIWRVVRITLQIQALACKLELGTFKTSCRFALNHYDIERANTIEPGFSTDVALVPS